MKTLKQEIYTGLRKYGIYLFLMGMAIGALVAHTQHIHDKWWLKWESNF